MDMPTVSLLGYTNSGKSTLFNLMTDERGRGVYGRSAVCHPRPDAPAYQRRRRGGEDTALAEVQSDLSAICPMTWWRRLNRRYRKCGRPPCCLHIVDAADTRISENIDAVDQVLAEIEANDTPTLLVMNKIDLLDNFAPRIDRDEENRPVRMWLSAHSYEGGRAVDAGLY